MRQAVAIGLLLGAILAVACGGGEERAATVAAATHTAESPEAARDQVPTLEAVDTPEERDAVTEADIAEALLTLDDMPTGWTTAPPEEDDDDDLDFCGQKWESTATAEVEAMFQASETGPFLSQVVQAFAPGEAERAMAAALERAQSCTEWTETQEDGTEVTYQIAPLSFPRIGDETLALRLSAEVPFFGFITMDAVYVRRGDLATGVAHVAIGFAGIDSEQTERFVRIADERLAALE